MEELMRLMMGCLLMGAVMIIAGALMPISVWNRGEEEKKRAVRTGMIFVALGEIFFIIPIIWIRLN